MLARAEPREAIKGEGTTGETRLTRPPTPPRHSIIQTAPFKAEEDTLWTKCSVCSLEAHDLTAVYLGPVGAFRAEEEGVGLRFTLGLGEEGPGEEEADCGEDGGHREEVWGRDVESVLEVGLVSGGGADLLRYSVFNTSFGCSVCHDLCNAGNSDRCGEAGFQEAHVFSAVAFVCASTLVVCATEPTSKRTCSSWCYPLMALDDVLPTVARVCEPCDAQVQEERSKTDSKSTQGQG